jgi:hypothetical protein
MKGFLLAGILAGIVGGLIIAPPKVEAYDLMTNDCQFWVAIAAMEQKLDKAPPEIWQRAQIADPFRAWQCGWKGLWGRR